MAPILSKQLTPAGVRTVKVKEIECPGPTKCPTKKNAGKNVRICDHYNFAVKQPKLLLEWDYDKNTVDPTMISPGSTVPRWWKCSTCGYSWEASPISRTMAGRHFTNSQSEIFNGNGCPKCTEERGLPLEEYILPPQGRIVSCVPPGPGNEESYLITIRTYKCPGVKRCCTRRYVGGGKYVCAHYNFFVIHPVIAEEFYYEMNKKKPWDYTPISGVPVWWKCLYDETHIWEAPISYRTSEASQNGCPYCSGNRVSDLNRLDLKFPLLIKQWHKDNPRPPSEYSFGSGEEVLWQCLINKDHVWKGKICHQSRKKNSCPFCTSQQVADSNRLSIHYPHLIIQWHSDNPGTPADYCTGSNERMKWICEVCSNIWYGTIVNRTRKKTGCPRCAARKRAFESALPKKYEDSLAYKLPHLVDEWDDDNNGAPSEYTPGSGYKANWVCSKGHKWCTMIATRSSGSGCPECNNNRMYSKVAIEWLDNISNEEEFYIKHGANEGEYYIEGVGYVDGFCEETNTVYEFHGDFFHGNPEVYPDREAKNRLNGKTYEELYQATLIRSQKIRDLGYNLIEMWEKDYRDSLRK